MKVISQRYEGYRIDVVEMDGTWQWNAFADEPMTARQVQCDGTRYEASERALIAARAAVDEVLGRAI